MLESIFSVIHIKIKWLAKIIFVASLCWNVIMAMFLGSMGDVMFVLLNCLAMILIFTTISFALYGFGELLERKYLDSEKLDENNRLLRELIDIQNKENE